MNLTTALAIAKHLLDNTEIEDIEIEKLTKGYTVTILDSYLSQREIEAVHALVIDTTNLKIKFEDSKLQVVARDLE